MNEEFNDFFNRQIKLWGQETQDSLQDKSIAIIGSGGLGCSLAIALGATGIGRIALVDFDEVGVHNIHRQIGFKVGDDGRYKCEVLKELVESRCPFVKAEAYKLGFNDFVKEVDATEFDLIIDATDNLPTRGDINSYAKENNIPWLYGSVEAFHGQVCFFEKASYESVFKITDRKPAGIACPIVMNIASLQANIVIRYLSGLPIKKDYLYYCFFNEEGEYTLQKFGLPVD